VTHSLHGGRFLAALCAALFATSVACNTTKDAPPDGASGAAGSAAAGRGAGGGPSGTSGDAGSIAGSPPLAGAPGAASGGTGLAGAMSGGGDSAGGTQGGNAGAAADSGAAGSAGNAAGSGGAGAASTGPIRIHWVDVEGGGATLIVTPSEEVILVDTGFPGARDTERIASVLEELGATAIDYLIVTHYHGDHVGNVAALAERFEVRSFVDHGTSVEAGADRDYLAAAGMNRLTVRAGDTLPLNELSLTFVSSNGEVLASALEGGGPNPACVGAPVRAKVPSDENGRSVGFVLRRGNFTFLDLGDLLWGNEHELVCPDNRLGQIDLFQISHHGLDSSNSPQLVHGIQPVVAVLNNGPRKGGTAAAFEVVSGAPGLQDIWQLHRALGTDAAHNTEPERIANLEEGSADAAHSIEAVIDAEGLITVTNGRNGVSKSYASR
jgi:competence protein ComEC